MSRQDGPAGPPLPVADPDSGPFWEGLGRHRVVLQQCTACAGRRLPPMPACPYCAATGSEDVEVSGSGSVYSYVVVHRALTPAMEDQVPYCIATVDLDGGGRIHGRLEPASAAAIGQPVDAVFVDHPGWTELRFRAAAPLAAPGMGTAQ